MTIVNLFTIKYKQQKRCKGCSEFSGIPDPLPLKKVKIAYFFVYLPTSDPTTEKSRLQLSYIITLNNEIIKNVLQMQSQKWFLTQEITN